MRHTKRSPAFYLIVYATLISCVGCRRGLFFEDPRDATTPLRVRGGAMGFRSDKQWVMNSDGSYCSAVPPITQIDLDDVDPSPASTIKPVTFPISITARKSDGSADSISGITMTYGVSSSCLNGGIQLTTINSMPTTDSGSGGSVYGFYSPTTGIDVRHEESSSHKNNRIRYKNSTSRCIADPSKPYYDEDACEQMSIVTVNSTNYTCINGECDLLLHP